MLIAFAGLRAKVSIAMPASTLAKLAVLALFLGMQGCMLAPGMKMETDGELSNIKVPVMKDGHATIEQVKIEPITAELLVARMNGARQQVNLPETPEPVEAHTYLIGPRDRLQITVWEHPELNDPGREKILPELAGKVVQDDGTLYYPYVGNLHVAGRSIGEVRETLTRELSKYFKKVKLDVRVLSFQSQRVNVVGEVKTPGLLPVMETPLTVAEAISRAGGVTAEADLSNVTLSRGDKLYPIDVLALYEQGNSAQNQYLKDGDVLNVPDRKDNKVIVMGEVGKQQSLQINKGRMSLAQALSEGGGVSFDSSKPEEIYVIRGKQDIPEIFSINAGSPDALILADQFPLKSHDIVFVGTAAITRWSRVINQLLPSAVNQMLLRGMFMGM